MNQALLVQWTSGRRGGHGRLCLDDDSDLRARRRSDGDLLAAHRSGTIEHERDVDRRALGPARLLGRRA
jgi:hypothetical protein